MRRVRESSNSQSIYRGKQLGIFLSKTPTKSRRACSLELQYGDDCAPIAHSPNQLQETINAFNEAYTMLGLRINAGKTKTPAITTSTTQRKFMVGEEELENVTQFCYLGISQPRTPP